ncbi:hypothetical protein ACETIH_13870 [Microvirga arabica]|uniref:Uncharacterized protein n=1 Tax=Microvirga arabica TaxID=1128671 RepID=A0ABV6Y961_9HYPH
MRKVFVTLLAALVAGLGAVSLLPFQKLKKQYAWIDAAVASGKTFVLNDASGEISFCFVGPQGFPVATARDQFKDYWIEPTASDLLMDSTGSWTLAIASKAQGLVSFRTNPIPPGHNFPEEVVCGDTIQIAVAGEKWIVKEAPQPNRSIP